MMYLFAQTWLFLLISYLIGMVTMHFLGRNQKSERQSQLESEALDARHRAITVEKEIEDYRGRLAELEGLPLSARASRIAAREEITSRLTQLERELGVAQSSEKRLADETTRLKSEVDAFRTRYLEARAKWDEYQAKAEALASAPQPLNLGAAQIVPDESMRKRVLELEGKLAEVSRDRDQVAEQARSLTGRTRELERQIANAATGSERTSEVAKTLQTRIFELESQVTQLAGQRDTAMQQGQQSGSRIKDLETRIVAAGQGFDKTAETAKLLQGRIAELEASLVTASRERERSDQKAQQLSGRIAEAEAKSSSVGQLHEKVSETARTLQARASELENHLSASFAAARDADGLRSRVAELQDKLSEAEIALRKSLATTKEEADPLRARINELETKLAHAAATNVQGDTIGVMQSADNVELRAKLAASEAKVEAARSLEAEVQSLRQRVAQASVPSAGPSVADIQKYELQITTLQRALEVAQRQAGDVTPLRQHIASLEERLANAAASASKSEGGEDVSLLKARLADMEARVMANSQSSLELNSMRSRIFTLEAMLHEAAKSRDEATVLRSKVAELDGRLGQAMKSAAEARARIAETPAV